MDILYQYINKIILYTDQNLIIATLLYFIFIFIYSTFSLPGLLIFVILSGYLFGLFYGYLISVIAITFGSFAFFTLSKFIFKYFFYNYYNKYTNNIDKFISNSSFEYLIIFRLIPGNPLLIQNLILSLLKISFFKFIFTSFIGFSPFIFLAAFIGNKITYIKSIKEITSIKIFTWDFLIIIFIVIFIIFLRIKFKKKI